MITTIAVLVLASADVQLQTWVDEGAGVPDEQVGKYAGESPNQLSELTVMARVRALQDSLTQSELDEQARAFSAQGADAKLGVEVRRRAWFTACHFQRSETVRPLIEATASGPLPVRRTATMCLGRYGTVDLYFHREVQKGQILHVAYRSHPSEAAHQAAMALAESPELELRSSAWQALRYFESPALTPLVQRMMKRGETAPVFLELLGAFPGRAVTDYLRKLATHPTLEVRRAAAGELAYRQTQVPRAALLSLLADPDDAVSTAGLAGLRRQLNLPLSPPQLSVDRAAMARLFAQRFAPGFRPAPLDKRMPPEVDEALELRKAGRSAEAADRLKTLARRAFASGDQRTAAIALHRAGDAYADDRDCNSAVDAYWQALVMHELRGDAHFAGVAANDLGLLWFKCGWHIGSNSTELFEYVVRLRRGGDDKEALRKALNNYSTSLIGLLWLDEAEPVVAESLALAKELGDPVAERKAYTNEAYRLALYCTELARLRVRRQADGDGLPLPAQCVLRADSTPWFTPEAEAHLRAVVKLAVDAARKTNVDNETLCTAFGSPGKFMCEWFPARK